MSDALSGRQRLLRAIHGQPVDRIPISPFIHENYVKEFFGTHQVDPALQTPEVYRHFGFDLMHRNCTPAYDPYGPPGPDWQVECVTQRSGRDETRTFSIHTPRGDLRAVEATRWTCEYDAESAPVEYLIKDEADFDLMERYQPAPGRTDSTAMARARAAVGEDGIIAPWANGPFNVVAFHYRKLDDLLTDALVRPAFYARLLTYCMQRYRSFLLALRQAGADLVSYGGNVANAKLVGPGFFAQYVAPYEREQIAFIQGGGTPVLYHNCGRARRLLPLYPGLGMRAYESLTPPSHGDTVLDEALTIFGCGTTLLGNIDQIDLLRQGTPAEIEAQVRQTLDCARAHASGGQAHFILATTDYFNENTPHDNVHALADAGHRHGYL
jgi:uroporphyrinogen decarboxylase